MIYWSIALGVAGVLATWWLMTRLGRKRPDRPPEVYWVLGIAAFSPAWLIAVLGLLGRMKGRFPDMSVAVWWLVSGAAALLGVIVTDGLLRRLHDSGRDYPPARYWEVGLGTFFPAWCVALLGLALTSPGDER